MTELLKDQLVVLRDEVAERTGYDNGRRPG